MRWAWHPAHVLAGAFAHRNFRLYILGQGVSIIGSWMQQVAMAWLVYQLTGSALWLGLVGFAGQIPALFLTPLAGCLIDLRRSTAIAVLYASDGDEPGGVAGNFDRCGSRGTLAYSDTGQTFLLASSMPWISRCANPS